MQKETRNKLEERVRSIDPRKRVILETISGRSSIGIFYEDVKRLANIAEGIQEGRVVIGIYTPENVTALVRGEELPTSGYVHLREAQRMYLCGEMEKARIPLVSGRPPRTMIRDAVKTTYHLQEQQRIVENERAKKVALTALASAYERGECFGEAEPEDLEAAEILLPPLKKEQRDAEKAWQRMKELLDAGRYNYARSISNNEGESRGSVTGYKLKRSGAATLFVGVENPNQKVYK